MSVQISSYDGGQAPRLVVLLSLSWRFGGVDAVIIYRQRLPLLTTENVEMPGEAVTCSW